jgi:hypothetical protein
MTNLVAGDGITLTPNYSNNTLAVSVSLDMAALLASGGIYGSTTDGLAATVDGDYFWVETDGADSIPLYKNVAGSAVAQDVELPTLAALNASSIADVVAAVVGEARDPRISLFFPEEATVGFTFGAGTGTPVALAGNFITGYMPVTPGGAVTVSKAIAGGGQLAFFDKSRTYISTTTTGAAWTAHAVPATASFARIALPMKVFGDSYALNYDPDLLVYDGSVSGTPGRLDGRIATHADVSPWYGKKIVILGDSRVKNDTYNWFKRVCANNGATLGLQDVNGRPDTALSGRRFAKALYRADDTTALTASDFTDVDGVLIQLGTNDADDGLAVGAITDSAATNTVYGHLRRIVSTLIGWKPHMRIGLITPFFRTDVDQATTRSYADAFIAFGRYYGCPVLDHCQTSGINEYNAATFLQDTVHQREGSGISDPNNGYNFGSVNQYDRFLHGDFTPPTHFVPYVDVAS